MREEFLHIRSVLAEYGVAEPGAFRVPIHRRLMRALASARAGAQLGESDLVALVSHVLRREEVLSPGQAVWLRVPAPGGESGNGCGWPDAAAWRAAHLGVREEDGRYRLTPRPWEPSWLPGHRGSALTDPVFAEVHRRTYGEVNGDPYLRAIGRSRYRCDAQREATRAILSVPAGGTIVVNLPTGAGKSQCAHLPAIIQGQRGGVSVVVVPTTTLALDQERALREWVSHDTAYVGGTRTPDESRRAGIRARIRDGSQKIVFTSPEALLLSLRPSIYRAAERGLLRFFVIDEAHMVEQWGDEFRSAFQEISGLRTDLYRQIPSQARPFTTVLLTATLTESALDTLETLFGEPGPLTVISAAQLRPEPSYWSVRTGDEAQQTAAVLDAIRHLPRPLLLYVTQPAEAEEWGARLRANGYTRVDVVSGRTPNDERGRVVQRWRDGDTDIVVATSAFGLGVDQAEVRAVIHATVPENVDRFYQEVGRGGRDGAASASIVIYTAEDVHRAGSMNQKKIIGIERGQERWTRMFDRRADLGGGRFRVPVDVQPSLRPGDINMDNDLNVAWNIRTLTLMSRARLLVLDAESPPAASGASTSADESREAYEREIREHQRHRVVSLRHFGTTRNDVWENEVAPVRRRTYAADRRNHELLLELLEGGRCVADILAESYTIPSRNGEHSRHGVPVARACGGCEYCRANGRDPWAEPLPTSFPKWPVETSTGEALDGLRRSGRGVAVFYRSSASVRVPRLLQWAVGQGVRVLAMPAASLVEFSDYLHGARAANQCLFTYALEDFRFLAAPSMPSLVYLPPGGALPSQLRGAFDNPAIGAQVRLLVAPSEVGDPHKPQNALRSMLTCATYDFDELSLRLGL